MKFDKSFVSILIIAALIGIGYGGFYIPLILSDPRSTWLRFSQSFFNPLTALPLGVIGFGGFIIADALFRRKDKEKSTLYKLIFCGILVILLGLGFFWFYILD